MEEVKLTNIRPERVPMRGRSKPNIIPIRKIKSSAIGVVKPPEFSKLRITGKERKRNEKIPAKTIIEIVRA